MSCVSWPWPESVSVRCSLSVEGRAMVDLCLIVVLLATTVQLGEARWGQAAKYDNHIDAGVRGQGHLKHP